MPPVPQYIAKLMSDLSRLEGKVDTFINQMAVADERATALEVRTRKLETRQHTYSIGGGVLGAIAGAAAEFFAGRSGH